MNFNVFFKQNRNSHRVVNGAITAVFCSVLFFIQSQIKIPEFSAKYSQNKILSSDFIKFSTIGYWPAAVDWMWIETLQRNGDRNYSPELIPSIKAFYQMATDLDPKFYELYEQAGVILSFYFHAPDESIHFLDKGIRFYDHANGTSEVKTWSHAYTLHLLLAYQYSFEKKDWSKAKEYYLKAAAVPGAPGYLQSMRMWLKEKGSEKELAKRVLNLLIKSTTDPILKSQYEEKLKNDDRS